METVAASKWMYGSIPAEKKWWLALKYDREVQTGIHDLHMQEVWRGKYGRAVDGQRDCTIPKPVSPVAGAFPAYDAALQIMPNPLMSFSALNGTIDWK